MVDRTAQAFRLKDEPSLGELESGLTSGYRDYTPEDKQTEEAFAEPELDVFSLPMGANPEKDVFVGEDELGNKVYKSPLGVRYTIKTVQQPERFTTEPATMARFGEVVKEYATGAIEGLTSAVTAPGRALAGEPVTTGEVLDTAGLAATGAIPSIARSVMEGGYDPNTLYVFGGVKAKQADIAKATEASEMFNRRRAELEQQSAGQPRYTPPERFDQAASYDVWQQTGWFRGRDGKMRFEINDSKSQILPEQITAFDDKFSFENALQEKQLYDAAAGIGAPAQYKGPKITTVGDVLKHDQLFANYPQIADIPIFVDNTLGKGLSKDTLGYFSTTPGKNLIAIRQDIAADPVKLRSTLLHEIQHYIQSIENFEGGANAREYTIITVYDLEKSLQSDKVKKIWDEYIQDVDVYNEQAKKIDAALEQTKQKLPVDVLSFALELAEKKYGVSETEILNYLSSVSKDKLFSGKVEDSITYKLNRKLPFDLKYAIQEAFKLAENPNTNFKPQKKSYGNIESEDSGKLVFILSDLQKLSPSDFFDYFNVTISSNMKSNDIYSQFLPPELKNIQPPKKPLFIDPSSKGISIFDMHGIYRRNAGETEARLAQQRMDVPEEITSQDYPRASEDIPAEFQWTREELANELQRGTSTFSEENSVNSIQLPPPKASQRTQIAGTFPTYEKAAKIFNEVAPEGRSLDYGAGLGKSSELGFDTFEPFAREGFDPTYRSSSDVPDASYERVTNLNVLNVVDPETRRNIVVDIGRVLKPNGVAIITTRGRDVLTAKGERGPEEMSIITTAGTYQKGFTKAELVSYLQDTLGEGFEVSPLNLGPAGAIVKKISSEQGYAQGGMVDYNTETQMNRLMQEGGIADDGMRRDPVSGNEIPPGSMAEEVRDDIPAQLSTGEYVVPADVLRYYGVAFFEKLRDKAKKGLADMEKGGRIGGEPVDMEEGEEEEDEDELPFDISELETSGDDTDMQMAAMGMAAGGIVKMQEGGIPRSTFNPVQFQTPGSTYFATPATPPAQQSEYRVYQNAQGQTLSILFVNGVPQQAIPEGYFPQGQAPAVTPPAPQDASDREDREPQQPAKSFSEYTAQDWMNYRPDTGVGSTMGKIAGGVIGGALLGPAGAMIGGKLAEEGMARNSVSAYNALNDYVATLSRNDPNYADLADKRNKMYGDLTAAQQENPSFFGNIFNNIFGKPEIAAPKTGTGGARPVATTAPAAAPAATSGRAEPSTQVSSGRGSVQATAPTTPRRAEPSTQVSSGRGAVQATVPAAAPARTTPRVAQDQRLGAGARGAAKGGLMEKKQKNTQKRKIKTTDA